jgi:hypothetical protein
MSYGKSLGERDGWGQSASKSGFFHELKRRLAAQMAVGTLSENVGKSYGK